jgi:excisionase family DNA binding protein
MHPTDPLSFTPAEAAARLGASESYLRAQARAGLVPHLRVGRRAIRFTEGQVQEILGIWSRPAQPVASRLTSPRSRTRAA